MAKAIQGELPRKANHIAREVLPRFSTQTRREFSSAQVLAVVEQRFGISARYIFINSVWAFIPEASGNGASK